MARLSNRDFQIIVGGFGEDTEAEAIEETINDFLKQSNIPIEDKKVFTFSDPAQVGVIEFPTIDAKIKFYKKIANIEKSIGDDKEMCFTNNRTFERRARDKVLGQIKHMLISKKSFKKEDVQIMWKHGTVKVKGKKVGNVAEGGTFNVFGEAETLKEPITEIMKTWFEKKNADAPYGE